MKDVPILILVFLILLLSPAWAGWFTTVSEEVQLRVSPSDEAESVTVLPAESELFFLREGLDSDGRIWFLVRTEDSEEGWVASWLINPGELSWVVADEDQLNLREGPGTPYPAITQLAAGTILITLTKETDEEGRIWFQVRTPEELEGWVASWYVHAGLQSPPPPMPIEIQAPSGGITLWDIYYHWAKEQIVAQVQSGLVIGYPDQTFHPDEPLTRAEFYTLLVRFKQLVLLESPGPVFSDVSGEHWASRFIYTAIKAGYLGPGPFPESFTPDQPIQRAEIAQAAVRALQLEAVALSRPEARTVTTDTLPQGLASFVQVAMEAGLVSGYPDGTFRPGRNATRSEALVVLQRMRVPKDPGQTYLAQKVVVLSQTRTITVDFVRVNLDIPSIRPRVFLADDFVARLESLQSLGDRSQAVVAVAAAYFDKKNSDPLDPDGPKRYIWGNLENDGTFITLTNGGTSVGFTQTKEVQFAPLEVGITGRIIPQNMDGRKPEDLSFYISGVNQPLLPESVRLYTPLYGSEVNVGEGKAIVFRRYEVQEIKSGVVTIPSDGFVLAAPAGSWLYAHFRTGDRVELQYKYQHNVTKELLPWQQVQTTISAGPRLLKAGQVALDQSQENFDTSLLAQTAKRNALGLSGSHMMVVANVMEPITLAELAQVMLALDCQEAVNLDGGASAGLYYKGWVVNPTRGSLTNVLAFLEG
jgi:hypothetical protein